MSAGHARLSASAAHRWLHCAGSLGDSQPSQYTADGTFAHHIAAELLSHGGSTTDWLGNVTIIDGFTVTCDQEMIDAVMLYLDTITEDAQDGDKTWVEMPLLNALQKVDKDMGGTADFVRYRPSTRHLRVFDYKFGSGTYVEVDDNTQMKIYALGAMLETHALIHEVTITIVQPRFEGAKPVRDYTFRAVDILEFVADLKIAADKTRLPNPELVAGPQCKAFCPNARTCPELERMHHALVAVDFDTLLAKTERDREGQLVCDPAKLAAALVAIPLVKERIKAIEEFGYAEAIRGAVIPGFKLVDKRPTRKWINDADVKQWATMFGVDPYAPPELLSPAQLEKKLEATAPKGKKKDAGRVIEPLVQKISSGLALVPVSDDRAPAHRITAADFVAIDSATDSTTPTV